MSRPLGLKAGTPPSKIQDGHLERLAIVYVRQSTLQQLEHHRESTRVQYALADRACLLGWARPRVIVIDDDLGCSRASRAPAATGTTCSRSAPWQELSSPTTTASTIPLLDTPIRPMNARPEQV